MLQSILAKLNLAWTLVLHLLKKPFRRRAGLEQFLKYYGPEGLLPINLHEKAMLRALSRCINCGLCDQGCPALWELPRQEFPGPSALVLSWARAVPPVRGLPINLSWCEACSRCETVCPVQVPVKSALGFLAQQKEKLGPYLP